MKKITPLRQIAALYGAILDIGLSLKESANALRLIEKNVYILSEAGARAYPPAPTKLDYRGNSSCFLWATRRYFKLVQKAFECLH